MSFVNIKRSNITAGKYKKYHAFASGLPFLLSMLNAVNKIVGGMNICGT